MRAGCTHVPRRFHATRADIATSVPLDPPCDFQCGPVALYDPPTTMAKSEPQLDVLVLGDHPAAYLCAALLKHKTKLRVLHSTLPGESAPDRLVLINPELFSLHPLTEPLRRKMDLTGVYGVRFLADGAETASEHRTRSPQ